MVLAMNNETDEIIERIVRLMQTDDAQDAPADSVKWAKNLFRARRAEPKKSLAQKVFAVLRVDLSGATPAFGERSASAANARQMLFQAGENAVDLRIAESENGFDLTGQILGAGFASCAVRLGDFETVANDLSEFKFSGIAAGTYRLALQTAEKEIVVEQLSLLP
jgi:hypothetical protein